MQWAIPVFYYTVIGSTLALFLVAVRVPARVLRIAMLAVILSWMVLGAKAAKYPNQEEFLGSVIDGISRAVGCLPYYGLRCLVPQKEASATNGHTISDAAVWITLVLLIGIFTRYLELRNAKNAKSSRALIQIGKIVDATADDPSVDGAKHSVECEAYMRTALSEAEVLAPPPVPYAEPALTLPTVLVTPTTDTGNWFAKMTGVILQWAFPVKEWKLSARITREVENFSIAIEIIDTSGRQSILQETFTGKELAQAAQRAAYAVARLALENSGLPYWARWRAKEGEGLRLYSEARAMNRKGHHMEGEECLRKSVGLEPGNAIAQAEWALMMERTEPSNYLDALEVYLRATRQYPRMYHCQYRAAVVLDLAPAWIEQWRKDTVKRCRLHDALEKAGVSAEAKQGEPNIPAIARGRGFIAQDAVPDIAVIKFFLRCAGNQFHRLNEEFKYRTLVEIIAKQEERPFPLSTWFRPFGTFRRQTLRAIKCAQVAHDLRGHLIERGYKDSIPALETLKIEHNFRDLVASINKEAAERFDLAKKYTWRPPLKIGRVRSLGRIQIVSLAPYNAACFYAHLIEAPPEPEREDAWRSWEEKTRPAVEQSLNYLDTAIGEKELRPGWMKSLKGDPDLSNLCRHPLFTEWIPSRIGPNGASATAADNFPQSVPTDDGRNIRCRSYTGSHAWYFVAKRRKCAFCKARKHMPTWVNRPGRRSARDIWKEAATEIT